MEKHENDRQGAVRTFLKKSLSKTRNAMGAHLKAFWNGMRKASSKILKTLWSGIYKVLRAIKPDTKLARYLYPAIGALLIVAFFMTGALNSADRRTQDSLFQHPGVTSGDIVIIGIDSESLKILNREAMADALFVLNGDPSKRPAVIAIDVLYAGDSGDSNADQFLAQAAEFRGNVITASFAHFGDVVEYNENGRAESMRADVVGYELPFEALREVTVQGHINAMDDTDGILRHALLYVKPDGETVYSMAYETARFYLAQQGKTIKQPPVNAAGHFYVPFRSEPGGYYDEMTFEMLITGQIDPSYWAGKIVLIGVYAAGDTDAYFTSIEKGEKMYGVEFQANVIQSLIDEDFKVEVLNPYQYVALFVLCYVAMFLFMRFNPLIGLAFLAGFVLVGVGGPMLLYRWGYVTHPLWLPVGAVILYLISLVLYLIDLLVKYLRTVKEKRRLELEKERIKAELSLATRIQANSLIKEFPAFPDRNEFDVRASMVPAKEVGGDLYDFFMPDNDHLVLAIGDVSGKGVPAALFMMVTLTLLRHIAKNELSPAKALQAVNNAICDRNPEEMFVTVWLGVLEISTGKLTCVNAGHEYPAIKQPNGNFELLKDKHGFVVGGMEGARYREYELQLEPGSKLFVYTDGVAEANNEEEQLFGTERMIDALRHSQYAEPDEILTSMDSEVKRFVGAAEQFDDMTMLCLKYNGVKA